MVDYKKKYLKYKKKYLITKKLYGGAEESESPGGAEESESLGDDKSLNDNEVLEWFKGIFDDNEATKYYEKFQEDEYDEMELLKLLKEDDIKDWVEKDEHKEIILNEIEFYKHITSDVQNDLDTRPVEMHNLLNYLYKKIDIFIEKFKWKEAGKKREQIREQIIEQLKNFMAKLDNPKFKGDWTVKSMKIKAEAELGMFNKYATLGTVRNYDKSHRKKIISD